MRIGVPCNMPRYVCGKLPSLFCRLYVCRFNPTRRDAPYLAATQRQAIDTSERWPNHGVAIVAHLDGVLSYNRHHTPLDFKNP